MAQQLCVRQQQMMHKCVRIQRLPTVRRAPLRCRAELQSRPPRDPNSSDIKDTVVGEVDRFFKKYDVVSSGMGALVVTSFCVARGQNPFTALSITFVATIVALVVNELWFQDDCSNRF